MNYWRKIMLKGIKDILKKMGEGLIFADAGEMLADEQKARLLTRDKGSSRSVPETAPETAPEEEPSMRTWKRCHP